MSKAADDYEAIRRRLEELAAEKNLALTGSTLEEKPAPQVYPDYYGLNAQYQQASAGPVALVKWKQDQNRVWYATLTPNRVNG